MLQALHDLGACVLLGTTLALLGTLQALAAESPVVPATRTIDCASPRRERAFCAADLRGQRLAKVRQRAGTPCELGRNFGYGDDGLWVNDGCGARFEFSAVPAASAPSVTEPAAPGLLGSIRCVSAGRKRVTCAAPGAARVRLARQLGRAPCREGVSWGLAPQGIWVAEGCGGEFEIITRLSAAP